MGKHKLRELIEAVDATHPTLGPLIALECMVVKCHKLLIVVSPHGCGKSRASQFVGSQAPSKMILDRLSVAGLATSTDDFSNFDGVVVVDDIAKTQTQYARISTITTLAELVYSHYVSSHLSKLQFEIRDFNGSAIVNVQPVLLRTLVASAEWEASIQDKAIRYYHLHRPKNPVPKAPDYKISWGEDINKVEVPSLESKAGKMVLLAAKGQWGLARTREHTTDLIRAAAALDGRLKANPVDYRIVAEVIRPLRFEQVVLDKRDFEAQRELHANRLAILTEFMTYGSFALAQLAEDYHVSESQAYRLMSQYTKDWVIVSKNPTLYAPSQELLKTLLSKRLISENNRKPKE